MLWNYSTSRDDVHGNMTMNKPGLFFWVKAWVQVFSAYFALSSVAVLVFHAFHNDWAFVLIQAIIFATSWCWIVSGLRRDDRK